MHLEWYDWIVLAILVIFLPRAVLDAYHMSARGDGFWFVIGLLCTIGDLVYLVGHGMGSW